MPVNFITFTLSAECCYKDKNCTTYMAEEEFCCDYEALSFYGVNGVCTGW